MAAVPYERTLTEIKGGSMVEDKSIENICK